MTDKCECKDDEKEDLKEALKLSIENRAFEIELFWKRAVIFWGVIAVLFAAVGFISKSGGDDSLAFLLSLAGIVISFIWTLANRASKGWQESWEIKSEYLFDQIYKDSRVKNIFGKANKEDKKDKTFIEKWNNSHNRSLSRLLIVLSDFLVCFWVVIALYFLNREPCWWIIGFIAVVIICFYTFCATAATKTAIKWLGNQYIENLLSSYFDNIENKKKLETYLDKNTKIKINDIEIKDNESKDGFVNRVKREIM